MSETIAKAKKTDNKPSIDPQWIEGFTAHANNVLGEAIEFTFDGGNLWVATVAWWLASEELAHTEAILSFTPVTHITNSQELQLPADGEKDYTSALVFLILQILAAQFQPKTETDMRNRIEQDQIMPDAVFEFIMSASNFITPNYRDYHQKLGYLKRNVLSGNNSNETVSKDTKRVEKKDRSDLSRLRERIGLATEYEGEDADGSDERLFILLNLDNSATVPRGMPAGSTYTLLYSDLMGKTEKSYLVTADDKHFPRLATIEEQMCLAPEGRTAAATNDFIQLQLLQAEALIYMTYGPKGLNVSIRKEDWEILVNNLATLNIQITLSEVFTEIKSIFQGLFDSEAYFLMMRQETVNTMNGFTSSEAEMAELTTI